jgi:chromosome partitioning protein
MRKNFYTCEDTPMTTLTPRRLTFKTSVALQLLGAECAPRKLQELIGREKPTGQHHMRYTPEDIKTARIATGAAVARREKSVPPPVMTFRMTKGGVGKTSMSVNVATAIAMMGYRVLFIDADPQASATNLLGVDSNYEQDVMHIGHFLTKGPAPSPDKDLQQAIRPIFSDGALDLIPADITMSSSDATMVTLMANHERAHLFLRRNGEQLAAHYDVIIVDTAPGTTPIGLAFTFAAKDAGKIVTVVEPDGMCIKALDTLAGNLGEISTVTGVKLGMRILLNKYHPSMRHIKETMGVLYTRFGDALLDVIVPTYAGFGKQIATTNAQAAPLIETDATNAAATAIIEIAHSLIAEFGVTYAGDQK